jgi:hypothetical protein
MRSEGFIKVMPDRLAALEKDHLAMERLRKEDIGIYKVKGGWEAENFQLRSRVSAQDPADAILAVGK